MTFNRTCHIISCNRNVAAVVLYGSVSYRIVARDGTMMGHHRASRIRTLLCPYDLCHPRCCMEGRERREKETRKKNIRGGSKSMIDDGECSNCISASVLRTWCTVHAAACFTLNHRDGNESFTFKFLTRTHVRVHTRVVVLVYVTVPLFSRSQADDFGSKFWLDEFSAATKKRD